MKIGSLFLLFLLCISFSYGNTAPTYFVPKVYSIWPNFCIKHLFCCQQTCSSHVIFKNNQVLLEFQYDGTTANFIDSILLERVVSYAYLIPTNKKERCNYKICEHGEPVIREYQENCRRDCFEPEGYVHASNLCCKNDKFWKRCSDFPVECSYFDKNNEYYFHHFEQLLHYISLNNDCDCFWPQTSLKACQISDFAYKYILNMMDRHSHVIPNPQDPNDTIINPLQHRAISSYLTHAFFYSHYYNIFIDICKHIDICDKNSEFSIPFIINDLYKAIDILQPKFLSLYSSCLKKHPHPKIYYERGMIHMHRGDAIASLEDIHNFIDAFENINTKDAFFSELYLQEGTAYAELGLYDKAVEALSTAIHLNPENKEAYFERAAAFFELGEFEHSISDYLNSKLRPQAATLNKTNLSLGIANGIIGGTVSSVGEFFPSLLSSTYGLSQALWAFAENPIQVSSDFIDSVSSCFEYLRSASSLDLLKNVVPEIKVLLEEWDDLEDFDKGKKIGFIIGKYGIDIFGGYGITKAMQAYRNLKRANNLLTFETLALNQRNKTSLILEATKRAENRKHILMHASLKMQWDKQGKHLRDHRNFNPKKGLITHPDPQMLINKYAGNGQKITGNLGSPGYKERVDFKEVIGIYKHPTNQIELETSVGMICYAKDGVHIVPLKPTGFYEF